MQSGRSVKWTLTLALFRCPHAYPSASDISGDRVDRRSRPVIGQFSMAGLLGSRCFSELESGKAARDEGFPAGEMVGSEGGLEDLEGGDCWLDSDSFWAN